MQSQGMTFRLTESVTRRMRAVALVSLVIVAPSVALHAQKADGPEAVAKQFFAAVAAEDWDGAVKLMATQPIVEARDQQMMMMRSTRNLPTPQALMRMDTTLTLEDAKAQVAMMVRSNKNRPAQFTYVFSGVRDTTELMNLSPERLAASWLMRFDSRVQEREAAVAARCPAPPVGAFTRWEPHKIVGVIEAGDDAYVLHTDPQMAWRGQGLSLLGPSMMILHRANGTWRILPTYAMMSGGRGMAIALSTNCGR